MQPVPGNHDNRTAIIVALIMAVATVIAALIAFFKNDAPDAGGKAGDTVNAQNARNVVTNPQTAIFDNPGAHIGVKTEFQKQNSLFLQFVSAMQFAGKNEIRFAINNRTGRFIGDAEVSAFDISSTPPVRLGEPTRVSSGPGQFRSPPMHPGISLSGNPPDKIRLCLSFPAAESGAFTTVLMDMHGKLNQYKVLDYTMSTDFDVFLSKSRSDCNKSFLVKKFSASEYAEGSS